MRHSHRIALALGLLSFVLAIQPAASLADTLSAAPPDQLGKVNRRRWRMKDPPRSGIDSNSGDGLPWRETFWRQGP